MIKQESGFTMIELLVSMVIFVLLIAAASQIFTAQLTQFKQQSKIAETNIEGIIGLELLRRDIEGAGFGLPWVIPATVSYSTENSDNGYNDHSPNPPRAIFSGNGLGTDVAGSDELIIKATNIATSDTAQRWTWLRTGDVKRIWLSDDFVNSDRVIVVFPGSTIANSRTLEVSSADPTIWKTTYGATNNYAPIDAVVTNIIYGINPNTSATPTMPFNRADYYISTTNVPARCANGTGVLVKDVIQQFDGNRGGRLPLLDCVADFQVNFWLDTDNDGSINWPPSDDISGLTARQIRAQVKEVRVYIVAQEGQKDTAYDFSQGGVRTFLSAVESWGAFTRTINFTDLSGLIIAPDDYTDFRWKLYTLVVKPDNLLE